ncbi:uncharacterized protein LOC126401633 [Epinephelus moara]|uniref:uncharacterized protein LOC126401633 n=1 Tax=Epinephelus moara TaxID=300413 RepID=UPI00214EC4F7|nr:uncharacterized protein LOC126401633 [Epinephelus moara]
MKHMNIYKNFHKRLQNMKSPQKRQGPTPERGQPKKRRHIDLSSRDNGEDYDTDSSDQDSLTAQARHYKTLREMYRKSKPNQDAVSQVLALEVQARRAFIDSDALKEGDRPTKILDAYLCFKDLHHVMGELRLILDKGNSKFTDEVKKMGRLLLQVKYAIALFRALPTLFPSPTAPPKKLGHASEALLNNLQPTEDPTIYLQKRALSIPFLLFDRSSCLVAIGTTPYPTPHMPRNTSVKVCFI